ncbi:hypothetical protein PIB30_012533 [Stylosanthes scabra]|uniref:Uncharacterized protein n=1 Tax=Stylosanthes scabra TaxID=79078 RepID=A0ABU6V6Z4_9FABA|nr:hypothetical protein [Stylosanthes scabra]
MVQMGFQYLGKRGIMRRSGGYERLTSPSEKVVRLGKQGCWVKSVNGRLRGIRLSSRSKRVSLKAFSTVLLPMSKIVRMYNDVVNRMNLQELLGNAAVVVPTQWGLPTVISHHHHHSSVLCRRNNVTAVIPFERKLICY